MKTKAEERNNFLFKEEMFDAAYVEYSNYKKAKLNPPKSGQSLFKWEGVKLHHISVGVNQVDYLLYNGIIICTFSIGSDRMKKVYPFIERHWEERIKKFCAYIDKRKESE